MAPPTRACDDDVYNLSDAGSGAKEADGTFFLTSFSLFSLSIHLSFSLYTTGQKMKVGRVSRVTLSLSLSFSPLRYLSLPLFFFPSSVHVLCTGAFLCIINCRAPVVIDTCVTDEEGGVEREKPDVRLLWFMNVSLHTHTHTGWYSSYIIYTYTNMYARARNYRKRVSGTCDADGKTELVPLLSRSSDVLSDDHCTRAPSPRLKLYPYDGLQKIMAENSWF